MESLHDIGALDPFAGADQADDTNMACSTRAPPSNYVLAAPPQETQLAGLILFRTRLRGWHFLGLGVSASRGLRNQRLLHDYDSIDRTRYLHSHLS